MHGARWSAFTRRSIPCSRSGGARGEPFGGDHRVARRQGRSKRGESLDPQDYDADKNVTGRKRHVLVDTLGLLLGVSVPPADIQDRDGARRLLQDARRRYPFIEKIFADAAIKDRKWREPSSRQDAGKSRSSNVPTRQKASSLEFVNAFFGQPAPQLGWAARSDVVEKLKFRMRSIGTAGLIAREYALARIQNPAGVLRLFNLWTWSNRVRIVKRRFNVAI